MPLNYPGVARNLTSEWSLARLIQQLLNDSSVEDGRLVAQTIASLPNVASLTNGQDSHWTSYLLRLTREETNWSLAKNDLLSSLQSQFPADLRASTPIRDIANVNSYRPQDQTMNSVKLPTFAQWPIEDIRMMNLQAGVIYNLISDQMIEINEGKKSASDALTQLQFALNLLYLCVFEPVCGAWRAARTSINPKGDDDSIIAVMLQFQDRLVEVRKQASDHLKM